MHMNNKGFSLVELIIVISIIAVLAAGSISAIGIISSSDTKKCTYEMNDAIGSLYSTTMAKATKSVLYIYQYNSETYVKTMKSTDTFVADDTGKLVGSSRIHITVTGATFPLKIEFDRSDGSFKEPSANTEIKIGDSNPYVIHIVANTGKHYIEHE